MKQSSISSWFVFAMAICWLVLFVVSDVSAQDLGQYVGVVEAGRDAQKHVEELKRELLSSKCQCVPPVDIKWDTFSDPKYRFYSAKAFARVVKTLSRLCDKFQKHVCNEISEIRIGFYSEGKVQFYTNRTLLVSVGPGFVPDEEMIERTIKFALKLDEKED